MDKLLTTAEAGRCLGKHAETVRRMCEAGQVIGAERTDGGHWRIPESSVQERLLTIPEASQILGMSEHGLRDMCEKDRIADSKRTKKAGHWRIPERVVRAMAKPVVLRRRQNPQNI